MKISEKQKRDLRNAIYDSISRISVDLCLPKNQNLRLSEIKNEIWEKQKKILRTK